MTGEMLFLLGVNVFVGATLFFSVLKNSLPVTMVCAFTGVVMIGFAHAYFGKTGYDPYIQSVLVGAIVPLTVGLVVRSILEYWDRPKQHADN